MNANIFPALILGHLVGDYLLQNKWMAMNKSANWWTCTVHCLLYTVAVCLATCSLIKSPLWPIVVFATHFPIDYFGLADKWLLFINGRALTDFLANGHKNIPDAIIYKVDKQKGGTVKYERPTTEEERTNYHILRGGFSAVVYTATDNTMHLVLMYLSAQLFL